MKKTRIGLPVSISVTLLFVIFSSSIAGPYAVPNGPGTDLWKAQKTFVDRVELCNIPDSILQNMTTDDLIETVFNFPFIQNLFLYDDFISSLIKINSIYNGIDELLDRDDAPYYLCRRYLKNSDENKFARNLILEKLISTDDILPNLDSTKQKTLIDTLLNRFSSRLDSESILKESSITSSSFLMIRLLKYLHRSRFNELVENDNELKKFTETSRPPQRRLINKIILEVLRYKR